MPVFDDIHLADEILSSRQDRFLADPEGFEKKLNPNPPVGVVRLVDRSHGDLRVRRLVGGQRG
jgi:hypothetical protein